MATNFSGAASAGAVSIEAEVRRTRDLIDARCFAEALSAAQVLERRVPENRDVLYLLARGQRFLRRLPQALETLERLLRLHPRFSHAYEERGACHVAGRDAGRAIEALLTAVNMNPALPNSWAMLEKLYRMSGDGGNADVAAGQHAALQRLPEAVVAAMSFFANGEWAPAESIVRAFLRQHGKHAEAMRLLARIDLERRIFDDAERLLEAVLEMQPDYRAARYDYARALVERQKYPRAIEQLETLRALEPQNRHYRTLFATACAGLGRQDEAASLYRGLLEAAPEAFEIRMSLAHALKTMGHAEAAIDEYRRVAARRPGYGDAYWSLANLKTYRFTPLEIERMVSAEEQPDATMVDRYHLCFALGKAYEDAHEFERSFRYYERGNSLKKLESRYRPEFTERNTALQIEHCTRELFARLAAAGAKSPEPIFIVGLPRSGSTLVEQILASHSQVEGTQELAEIPRIVFDLEARYPEILHQLDAANFERLGEEYLRDTKAYRSGKPRFIDKMPNNFRHVGLLHLSLPNAKIIDVRRAPMACCFSNFKQLFASGQEFTYGLEDIGRYYRAYVELMQHWEQVLPGKVLRVDLEALVEDLDGSVRRLLDFCGLEFEANCLDFHNTTRNVRSASSEQVRRPISRQVVEQWTHYEPWLGELEAALQG